SDSEGDTAPTTLLIDFDDDAPTAVADTDSVTEGGSTSGNVLTGNADAFGADGADSGGGVVGVRADGSPANTTTAVLTGTGVAIAGDYGTLTLNADGSYTYQSTAGAVTGDEQDVFVYTIRDADGDLSTTTLTIDVANVTLEGDDQTKVVNEAALDLVADDRGAAGPSLEDDLAPGTVEGSNPGLDTETVTGQLTVAGDGVTYTLTGGTDAYGQLQLNSDGSYTYTLTSPFTTTPAANDGVTTETGAETYTYTATDANGNSATGTITIDIIDDVPQANSVTVSGQVDEDALPGGIEGGPGDIDGGAGTTTQVATGTSSNGQSAAALFTPGADQPLTITFVDNASSVVTDYLEALNLTSGGVALDYLVTSDGILGRAGAGGDPVFLLDLQSNGDWEFELFGPLDHSVNGTEDDIVIDFAPIIQATDADGDVVVATGSLQITVDDDLPVSLAPAASTVTNTAGSMSALFSLDTSDGDVDNNYGADGPGAVIFTAASISALEAQGLQSGFADLEYTITNGGTVLVATKATDDSEVFRIELQPTGGADQYKVTISQPLDATSDINFNDGTYDFIGGNDPWAGFVPDGQSPFVPGGGTPIADGSSDLLLTPIAAGNTADSINGTANGAGNGGIGGQNIDPGEGIRLDFVIDLNGDPAGSPANYDGNIAQQDHSFSGHDLVNGTSITFGQGSNNSLVRFTALNVVDGPDNGPAPDLVAGTGTTATVHRIAIEYDGEIESISYDPGATYPITVTVGSPGGLADRTYTVNFINDASGRYVEVNGVMDTAVQIAIFADGGYQALNIFNVSGDDFELSGFGTSTITNDPVPFTVPISIRDGDGDTVDAGTLSITANPGSPPVVLDLDGDGVELLGLDAGIAYDMDGDGVLESTAWAGADDGILVHDANGDGTVSGAGEFLFGTGNLTDLAAMAANFDANGDGVLDSNDAAYADFGVWSDANSNGIADDGEYASLADMGITSISLVGDGKGEVVAGGDATIHGHSTFTWANGSSGVLADVTFRLGSELRAGDIAIGSAAMAGFLAGMSASAAAQTHPHLVTSDLPAFEAVWGGYDPMVLKVLDGGAVGFDNAEFFEGGAGFGRAAPEAARTANDNLDDNLGNPLGQAISASDSPASQEAAADIGIEASAMAFDGHGASASAVMEALLIIGDAGAGATRPGTNMAEAAQEAIGDILADHAVDALVDRFVPDMAEAPESTAPVDQGQLAEALAISIDGSAFSIAPPVNEVSMDESGDLALLHG
ncbi:Ig-like domain-containing protein, partial [Aurantiacibacter odishensis]|uniref:T1SS-143 repeat domain-containing protein n=1 Tax=Aurantiacibacter odishensis TaxID=1155476 RepID=UPI000E7641C4